MNRPTAQWLALYRQRERRIGEMSEPQWRVLLDLYENGPARLCTVTATCGASFGKAYRHIDRLQKDGLVVSSGAAGVRMLALTDRGRAILDELNSPAFLSHDPARGGAAASSPVAAPAGFAPFHGGVCAG